MNHITFFNLYFKKLIILLIGVYGLHHTVFAQKVLIAYYSETGHTEAMAKAISAGAKQVENVEVRLLKIEEASADDLFWADGIILGSPVHSANVAAPVLAFIRNWPFENQPLKDKIGAAFVTGGGISAGEEAAQLSILRSMLVFNMIVVGGSDWTSPFGASAVMAEGLYNSGGDDPVLDQHFLDKGKALGRRVAELCLRIKK